MSDTPNTPKNPQTNIDRLEAIRVAATKKSGGIITRPGTAAPKPTPAPATVVSAPAVPARINRSDSFGLVATPTEPTQSGIIGRLLKFKKGEYSAERGAMLIELGTEFVVRDAVEARCLFLNGELVQTIKREPDQRFPTREELGYLDKAKWPIGLNNKPEDPWSIQFYLWMFSPEGLGDFTFVTSSNGGSKAVRHLCQQITYRRDTLGRDDLLPCVKLGISKWNSKQYGTILSPDFAVHGWVGGDLRPIEDLRLAEELDDSVDY